MRRSIRLWLVTVMAALLAWTGSALAAPTEIHWWHAMRGARGETVKKLAAAFNASQNDFVVIETNKGDYDETVNAGVAAYRAKKQPHILQSFEVGTQTMMLSGAIYPVYKLMADQGYKIDWSLYLQPVLSYYVDAKGNLQSMPFNSSTPVMFYNKDQFKQAGIAPLSRTEPITWDQLGELTAKLVASDVKKGLVTAWPSWVQIENYSAIHDLPFATRANGYEGLDTELTINNPQVVSHIALLKSWMADNRFSYVGQKYQGPEAAFFSQDAAILMDSISAIGAIKQNAKFNWDAAPLPVEASMKTPQNSIIGGASLWVMNGLPKKDYKGVAAFLNFLAQNDMQELWHIETGYLPITVSAYESLKAKGFYKEYPYQEVGIQQLMRRKPTVNSRGLRLGYFIQIRNIINEELELVWNGGKTPQQALDSAVQRGNDELRKFEKTYKK
ncbi:MAG: sn-glycerol-3-phosphate ABC transporter substrate-binding protein UgpB [Desulfobacterales bacterium]